MIDPARWLPIAGIVAFTAAFLFGVRLLVNRQSAKIALQLDQYDYLIIETHPLQLPHVRSDFERNGWRLHGSKQTMGVGLLSTFVKVSDTSAPLSHLLGFGEKVAPFSTDRGNVDFQMKIKAHGFKSELNA